LKISSTHIYGFCHYDSNPIHKFQILILKHYITTKLIWFMQFFTLNSEILTISLALNYLSEYRADKPTTMRAIVLPLDKTRTWMLRRLMTIAIVPNSQNFYKTCLITSAIILTK